MHTCNVHSLTAQSYLYMNEIIHIYICNIAMVRDIYAISRYTKFGYVITAVIYFNNQPNHLYIYGCIFQSSSSEKR